MVINANAELLRSNYKWTLPPLLCSGVLSAQTLRSLPWGSFFKQPFWFLGLAASGPLLLIGIRDKLQKKHSILRNYPIIGHIRFIFESIRPEMMQYFVETDTAGRPFNRNERTVVYERSKGVLDDKPFGTELDAYSTQYEWLNHSIAPSEKPTEPFRIDVGGPECSKPYSASVYNISAMSFGALSGHAIMALNKGAKKGGFFHDTGEGSISPYHRKYGGDLVWELGSGYFGCRTPDGNFDPAKYAEQAVEDQVKMIEIKVSQGAKAGHGGVLPAAKISAEIAETRGIPQGKDCISPAYHKAFSTPIELMQFIAQLREKSGGKPVGFKLCIGRPAEFMSICKAMIETEIYADFIVVDGGEGGTGAGPIEFLDHMGTPLTEGAPVYTQRPCWMRNSRSNQTGVQCKNRHCLWNRVSNGNRCRLVQLRSWIHVRRRLHSGPAMPHQYMPCRCNNTGSEAAKRAGCSRQSRACLQLPRQHA